MISRNSEGGFFAAHWDWLVAGAGVVALIVGIALFCHFSADFQGRGQ